MGDAGITSLLEISWEIERIEMRKIVYRTYVSGNVNDTYNIGLAKVDYAFIFTDYVKPVALPSNDVNFDFNKSYEMAFWGCKFVHSPTTRHFLSNPLEYTNVVFIPQVNSRTEPQFYNPSALFGQTSDGRGFGIGSFGYGVVAKKKEIYATYALFNKSASCNSEYFPSVFSRISYYVPIMNDKMNVLHQFPPK